jgi:hypothetical protein
MKRRLRALFLFGGTSVLARIGTNEDRRTMPLRSCELSGRDRSGAGIDLSLYRLSDPDRFALSVTVICSGADIRMTGKPPKTYAKVGDNGRTRVQHFCPDCGPPLFTSGEGDRSDDWGIRWSSIHQRAWLKPTRQIWCRSAAPWINDLEELPGRPTD